MKKYWLLLSLLISFVSAADTFFVSDRDPRNQHWVNGCTKGSCKSNPWFTDKEVDSRYHFGIRQLGGKLTDKPTDTVLDAQTFIQKLQMQKQMPAQLKSNGGRILLFVHGYNVTFDQAMMSMFDLAYDKQLKKVPFTPLVFDWASKGTISGYWSDEETAQRNIVGFAHLVRALTNHNAVNEIHIIAHSMGNRVVVGGLEQVANMLAGNFFLKSKLKTVTYFAADVDPREFANKIPTIHQSFQNLQGAVFYSEADIALKISSDAHQSNGRVGNTNSGQTGCIVNPNLTGTKSFVLPSIDLSILGLSFKDPIGHSYILKNPKVVAHIASLLQNVPQEQILHKHYSRMQNEMKFKDINGKLIVIKKLVSDLIGCGRDSWILIK